MSQSPFSKVIMATQSISEIQKQNAPSFKEIADRAKELEKRTEFNAYGEEKVYLLDNPYKYYMQPEFHLPHYHGKGHSTKGSNNDSSPAHTKKRKAKRRLNKKHNR